MALGALISAYGEASGPGGELRATLPLAGRSLLEYQARLAAAAGAAPIVALVERMPVALVAAIDRLGGEGIGVQLARGADAAARHFAPGDRVLLIADGLFADPASVERMAAAEMPTVLTLADNIGLDAFERIDGDNRWAGLAIASGAQLAHTAEKLGDWDLQSTLLRRLVQDGARRVALAVGSPPMIIAEGPRDLDDAQRRILTGARSARRDWVERFITPIVEDMAVERLMGTRIKPGSLLGVAAALTALAAFFFAKGWFGAALAALIASVPLDGIAERLAALRMRPLARADRLRAALPYLASAALAALAVRLASDGSDWGCVMAATATLAFGHAARVERGAELAPASPWLASRKGLILLALPFGAAGLWTSGLVAAALYTSGSFLWLQHLTHRPHRRSGLAPP